MTRFSDPSESLAPEAVFACMWGCGLHPHFSDVAEHLSTLRECSVNEATETLQQAIDAGEVRLRLSESHSTPYLAIDGSVADNIGIRYTFHKLWDAGLSPTDIYTGNGTEIVEAYQPLMIEALHEEDIAWPAR